MESDVPVVLYPADSQHFLDCGDKTDSVKQEPIYAELQTPSEETLAGLVKDEAVYYSDETEERTFESEMSNLEDSQDCDFKVHLEDLKQPNNDFFLNPSEVTLTPISKKGKKPRKKREPQVYKAEEYNRCNCGFVGRTTYALNRHLIIHQTDDEVIWHECEKCSFKTKHKESLRAHDRNIHTFHADKHAVNGVFQCDHCDFKSKSQRGYRRHIDTHLDSSLFFKCDICDFKTRRKKNLRTHSLIHKPKDSLEMHKCPHCEFQTKHRSSLSGHILTHFDPNPSPGRGRFKVDEKIRATFKFKCNYCEYRGKTSDIVKNHEITHIKDDSIKSIMCHFEGCSFKTARKNALKRHYLVHKSDAEVKWYKCDQCSFQTKHKGSIKNHNISHQAEIDSCKFKCDHCDYVTKWQNCFKRHLLAHIHAEVGGDLNEVTSKILKSDLKTEPMEEEQSRS